MTWAQLRLDVRLQARSRLYVIGIVVSVMLGALGRFLIGPQHAAQAVPILYLLGLGGTTYIYGATMVLLERSEGTLLAVRVSPLSAKTYLLSKLITLTAFATLEGLIVHAVGFWGVSVDPLPLFAGVLAVASLNALIGLGHVAPHTQLFSWLIPGALILSSVLQWPALFVLKVGPPAIWYLLPTQGPLLLMMAGFTPLEPWQWAYALISTTLSLVGLWWWSHRRIAKHLGLWSAHG